VAVSIGITNVNMHLNAIFGSYQSSAVLFLAIGLLVGWPVGVLAPLHRRFDKRTIIIAALLNPLASAIAVLYVAQKNFPGRAVRYLCLDLPACCLSRGGRRRAGDDFWGIDDGRHRTTSARAAARKASCSDATALLAKWRQRSYLVAGVGLDLIGFPVRMIPVKSLWRSDPVGVA
jgi:hypothetical protein